MATLHKIKILASQCGAAGSPTQSPTTSPVIHLRRRRRKTLQMLLARAADRRGIHRRCEDQSKLQEDPPEKRVRRKLKDLFVSSPPFEVTREKNRNGDEVPVTGSVDSRVGGGGGISGLVTRRCGTGAQRPVSGTFRYRLLRRAWRPVLVTIPEQ